MPLNLLPLGSDMPAGDVVVGHGKAFVRGPIVLADDRFIVQSMSARGCVGCPLFLDDMSLAGIVHGQHKYRSSRSDRNKHIFHQIYADRVGTAALRKVLDIDEPLRNEIAATKRELLSMAENITVEMCKNPDRPLEEGELVEIRQALYESTDGVVSLNRVMSDLKDAIWPMEEEAVVVLDLASAKICSTLSRRQLGGMQCD